MITAHITAKSGRRIYVRMVYLGNSWHRAISQIRTNLRLFGARKGLATSCVTGHSKLVSARKIKELRG
jgi:hypothetical protein